MNDQTNNKGSIRFYGIAACLAAVLALGLATTAMAAALHGVLCGLALSVAALIVLCCLYAHADLYTRTRCKDMLWQTVAVVGLFVIQFFVYDIGRCPVYTFSMFGETYAAAGIFSLLLQCLYLVSLGLLLLRVVLNVFGKTLFPFEKRLATADIENIEYRTSKADATRDIDAAKLLEQADRVMTAEKLEIKEETDTDNNPRDFVSPQQVRRDRQQRLLQTQADQPSIIEAQPAPTESREDTTTTAGNADTVATVNRADVEQRLHNEAVSIVDQDDDTTDYRPVAPADTAIDTTSDNGFDKTSEAVAATQSTDSNEVEGDNVIYANGAIDAGFVAIPDLPQDDLDLSDCDLRSEVVVHHTKQTKYDKDDALYTDFLYGDTEDDHE